MGKRNNLFYWEEDADPINGEGNGTNQPINGEPPKNPDKGKSGNGFQSPFNQNWKPFNWNWNPLNWNWTLFEKPPTFRSPDNISFQDPLINLIFFERRQEYLSLIDKYLKQRIDFFQFLREFSNLYEKNLKKFDQLKVTLDDQQMQKYMEGKKIRGFYPLIFKISEILERFFLYRDENNEIFEDLFESEITIMYELLQRY